MTLTAEEITKLFEPSKYEVQAMERKRSGKRKKDNLPTTEALFTAFGLIFQPTSCNRIAEYGVDKFIDEAKTALLENEGITSHIQELQKVEERLAVLNKKRQEIEDEIDNLEYGKGWEDEEEGELGQLQHEAIEIKLFKDMDITPTGSCAGDSFLRFFLLSFMESKTPKPIKPYSTLKRIERTAYIESLEKRINVLEDKLLGGEIVVQP